MSFCYCRWYLNTIIVWLFFVLDITFEMIWSLLFNTWGTHHASAGSCAILLCLVYSASSIEWFSFISLSGTHDDVPSLHITSKYHHFVVCLRLLLPFLPTIHSSPHCIAMLSWRWLLMWSNNWYRYPSSSTWQKMLWHMVLVAYCNIDPSENLTY